MSGSKSKVVANSIFYTLSSVLIKAGSFLLIPIYTSFLTTEEYGATNLIISFTNVVQIIVMLSLHSSIIRFYTEYKNNINNLKKLFSTAIIFTLLNGVLFFIISLIMSNIFVKLFFGGISYYPVIFFSVLNLIFSAQTILYQTILKGMQLGKKVTIINLLFFLLEIITTVLFIAVLKMELVGFVYSQLIKNVLYFIFMIFSLNKESLISYKIDFKILKELLAYSIPIIPHNLSSNIATWVSRLLLNKTGTLATVGLYSLATQISLLVDVIQSSVNMALTPWIFNILKEDKKELKNDMIKFSEILLKAYSLLYLLIGLFSQELLLILAGREYSRAWEVIPILIIGFSAKSIYYFYINILFYYKNAARRIFWATMTGSFADILLAYLLVPKYQIYGSGIAFSVAKIIIVVIVVLLSKKYADVGYNLIKMVSIISISLLFMGVGLIFSYSSNITDWNMYNLLYKLFITFIYCLYLFLSNKNSSMIVLRNLKIKIKK